MLADAANEEIASDAQPGVRRRVYASRTLIVLAATMLVVGSVATWVKRVALEPTTWADVSARALDDQTVRSTLTTYLVDQLYSNVDVAGAISAALPDRAKPLAAPAASGLREYAERAGTQALGSTRVNTLWRNANERADRQVVTLLDGGKGALQTTGGEVVLDLRPLVQGIAARAGIADRLGALPPNAGRVVVLRSDQLKQAQDGARLLRAIADTSVVIVLLLFVAAVWVAPDRRKAVRGCAIALLAGGLVLILVRRVLGGQLIDSLVPSAAIRPAANSVWWIATDQLRLINTTILAVGALGLVAAWVAGSSVRAIATRRFLAPYLAETALAYGVLTVVILALLAWGPTPAARNVVPAVTLIALALLGLEVLRRQAAREFPGAERQPLSLPRRRAEEPAGAALVRDVDLEEARLARLDRLAALHASGVLNDEEFAREKERVLAPMRTPVGAGPL